MIITRIEGQFNYDVFAAAGGGRTIQVWDPSGAIIQIALDPDSAADMAKRLQKPTVPTAPAPAIMIPSL